MRNVCLGMGFVVEGFCPYPMDENMDKYGMYAYGRKEGWLNEWKAGCVGGWTN